VSEDYSENTYKSFSLCDEYLSSLPSSYDYHVLASFQCMVFFSCNDAVHSTVLLYVELTVTVQQFVTVNLYLLMCIASVSLQKFRLTLTVSLCDKCYDIDSPPPLKFGLFLNAKKP
jgi:hypothetical protein